MWYICVLSETLSLKDHQLTECFIIISVYNNKTSFFFTINRYAGFHKQLRIMGYFDANEQKKHNLYNMIYL